ncbi:MULTISPECIES: hypothetical protein [unclassified Burkholderia]|uniref:hypothetical protein n=1 Tax=unclassified Burkholderia TaxID=2613784 RepID=UPI00211D2BED|nr:MULTISPECIES: hypothetical protein [unclassified Burkholderia]
MHVLQHVDGRKHVERIGEHVGLDARIVRQRRLRQVASTDLLRTQLGAGCIGGDPDELDTGRVRNRGAQAEQDSR